MARHLLITLLSPQMRQSQCFQDTKQISYQLNFPWHNSMTTGRRHLNNQRFRLKKSFKNLNWRRLICRKFWTGNIFGRLCHHKFHHVLPLLLAIPPPQHLACLQSKTQTSACHEDGNRKVQQVVYDDTEKHNRSNKSKLSTHCYHQWNWIHWNRVILW